jgi:phospholipase/lecithinase/hemolysin
MMKFERTMSLSRALVVGIFATLLAAPAAAQPGRFTEIVTFGTSLSDPGNAFALIGATNVPPDYSVDPFLVPDLPYARGGQHFSNGATWIEQLGRSMGLAGSVQAAFRGSVSNAHNFAVGGARAREDGVNVNLSRQVNTFLERSEGVASPSALYVIEMGGNDIRDALTVFAGGGDGGAVITGAVGSIGEQIAALYRAGARTFLLWNAPNVGRTPALQRLDAVAPGAAFFAGQLSQAFNGGLDAVADQLSHLPGLRMVRFDAYGTLNAIITNPGGFGLTDVTSACISPNIAPFVCDAPDAFLFWDGIHPTKAVHAMLAEQASRVLAQQP